MVNLVTVFKKNYENYEKTNYEISRGAGARVTANVTGCGFDFHSL